MTPSKKRAKYGIGLQSPSSRTSTWFFRALITETLKEKGVRGGWGRACSFVAGSRHLTVDHKPISRWSTPIRGISHGKQNLYPRIHLASLLLHMFIIQNKHTRGSRRLDLISERR